MNVKMFLLLILALGSPVGLLAEDFPQKNDFAYGFPLNTDGSMPLYKVLLPEEVYSITTRRDLGDIRIFNNQGETVPHIIKRPIPVETLPLQAVSLPYFPLYGSMSDVDTKTIRVETDRKGTIITVHDNRIEQSQAITGYIIDISGLQFLPESLQLDWQNQGNSFVASVAVSYSNDLSTWYPLRQNTTLARLKYNNHELVASAIPLPSKKINYLKMNWPVGKGRGPLTSVEAVPSRQQIRHQVCWKELYGGLRHKDSNTYEYDTGSNLPVEELNILFPYKNILVQAVVSSRAQQENPWVDRFQGLIYSMEVEGLVLANNSFKIPLTTDRYWLLKMTSIEGELSDTPRLRLGWVPHEILFVAQGQGPFLLAYGSSHVEAPSKSASNFFTSISTNESGSFISLDDAAQPIIYGKGGVGRSLSPGDTNGRKEIPILLTDLASRIELGGKAQLKPIRHLPWKRWILWTTMLMGLAVLGRMAWTLTMEMKGTK